MKKMTELYTLRQDVFVDEIPDDYKDDFNVFLYGQTCYMIEGRIVSNYEDYAIWYRMNKKSIERYETIESVLKK